MQKFAKPAIWLAFTAAAILAAYAVMNPEPDDNVDAEARAAIAKLQPPVTVGQPPDVLWAGERIINLPEDGSSWHTVLILDNGPASQRIAQEFNTNPRLAGLKNDTKFYQYPPDHWWVQKYRAGYQPPLVLVQRPSVATGGTNDFIRVYEQWGNGLPLTGDILADDIASMVRRPCPRPTPTPTPVPQPQPVQPVAPVAPVAPEPATIPPPEENDWLIYALIAGGGLLGAGKELKFGG